MTQKEFIVDLQFDTEHFNLFRPFDPNDLSSKVKAGIPSLEGSVSIRPKIIIEDIKYVLLGFHLNYINIGINI